MLSLKDFSDQVIGNISKRQPGTGREGFGLVSPPKQALGNPRVNRAFTGWLSQQDKSDSPVVPSPSVINTISAAPPQEANATTEDGLVRPPIHPMPPIPNATYGGGDTDKFNAPGMMNGVPLEYRATGGQFNPSRVTEVGEHGPELLVNNTVVPLNARDRAIGQRRGNLPQGNLGSLLSRIRHREYGGDVPNGTAEEPIDISQGETPNDRSTVYGGDVQGQPEDQQQQSVQPPPIAQPVAQPETEQPDTGDIYSQIAKGYADKIAALSNKDYGPKHHGGFKDILKGFGIGALQGLSKADPRAGIGAELGAALGGGGAGAVAGGIDASNPQRAIDDIRRAKLTQQATENAKLAKNQAQIDDIASKPQDRADALEVRRQAAEAKKVSDADKAATAKDKQKSVNRLRFVKNHGGKFDPANATEADKNELATFDETPESIGKFDINKPDVRTIAGKSYQWNGNTNKWDEAGLPTDGSKQVVDIEVVDPNTKVTHTYSTTSDHAATLQAGLERTGMQITAAANRAKTQQDFKASQNQKSRDFKADADTQRKNLGDAKARKQYTAGFVKTYQTHNHGKMPSQDQVKAFLNTLGFE